MNSKRITAIGEILYDVYPDQKRLGGAPFNFIYHIWKLTGKANFISSVGDDDNGREIMTYLRSIGFNTKFISIDKEHPTGIVQVKLLKDRIPQFTISQECSYDYITLNEASHNLIENETDLLYFGTLSQRSGVTRKSIQSLLYKNIKYFCDLNLRHNFFSKEIIESALRSSHVIKVNNDELKIINKLIYNGIAEEEPLVRKLVEDFEIDIFCVTFGADGATLTSQVESNTYKMEVSNLVDTVGAGDAYAAILCLGYLRQWDVKKINHLASNFAADLCTVEGAIPGEDSFYNKYKNEFNDG